MKMMIPPLGTEDPLEIIIIIITISMSLDSSFER
jgi:hypothetical protein